jgi:hypothetical protein
MAMESRPWPCQDRDNIVGMFACVTRVLLMLLQWGQFLARLGKTQISVQRYWIHCKLSKRSNIILWQLAADLSTELGPDSWYINVSCGLWSMVGCPVPGQLSDVREKGRTRYISIGRWWNILQNVCYQYVMHRWLQGNYANHCHWATPTNCKVWRSTARFAEAWRD